MSETKKKLLLSDPDFSDIPREEMLDREDSSADSLIAENPPNSRPHICIFCGSMNKQRSAVNEHIRIKHEKTAKA